MRRTLAAIVVAAALCQPALGQPASSEAPKSEATLARGATGIDGGNDPTITACGAAAPGLIARQFDHYDLVGYPEHHRSQESHELLRAVLADPEFLRRVNDVVVEGGNARFQAIADKYIAGEDVPPAEVRKIWRDTGQLLNWDSPLYEQFFRSVRDINASLPAGRRLRVVLGDPPIPWESVHTKDEYERYADRDLFYADTVEREVLAKGRKALLVYGGMHLIYDYKKRDIPDRQRDAADLIQRRHPGRLFVFWAADAAAVAPGQTPPIVRIAKGTPLGSEPFAPFAPKGIMVQKVVNGQKEWVPMDTSDWPRIDAITDGLIGLGPEHTILPDPAIYADPAYLAELRRRAKILSDVYGMDFDAMLDEAIHGK